MFLIFRNLPKLVLRIPIGFNAGPDPWSQINADADPDPDQALA
jgi:hypothetical protein